MAPDPRQLRTQRFPLHAAVENGDCDRVAGLLAGAMGSQVNRKYETSGQTPLHIAASSGSPALLQILLDAGALVGEVDCVKQTALHYSITNNQPQVMESLLRAGAEVNSRRMKDGWTPLFLAGIFGDTYKVQYLLDSGADVLLCDDRGLTVMDWVARYGMTGVQGQLRLAPRRVTEMSGKKYVEAEVDDKLEVPVEFDEGINKLLAKLEIKRKARIAEHKNLMMKMEKEKVEEKKQLEEKLEETQNSDGTEAADDKLTVATDNILQRQKRFLQEMEDKEDPQSPSKSKTDPQSNSSTTSQIPPPNISDMKIESREKVDLNHRSSVDVLGGQPKCDERVTVKRNKINKSCDKKSINGSFKASIDALFEKTKTPDDAENNPEGLVIKENRSIELLLETKSKKYSEEIPEIVESNCNLGNTVQDQNTSSDITSGSIITTNNAIQDSIKAADKIPDTENSQTRLKDARNENDNSENQGSLPTEIKHERSQNIQETRFEEKPRDRKNSGKHKVKQPGDGSLKDQSKDTAIVGLEKPEVIDVDVTGEKSKGFKKETNGRKDKPIMKSSKKKDQTQSGKSRKQNSDQDIAGNNLSPNSSHCDNKDNSRNLLENAIRKGDIIEKDKESDSIIESPQNGKKLSNEKSVSLKSGGFHDSEDNSQKILEGNFKTSEINNSVKIKIEEKKENIIPISNDITKSEENTQHGPDTSRNESKLQDVKVGNSLTTTKDSKINSVEMKTSEILETVNTITNEDKSDVYSKEDLQNNQPQKVAAGQINISDNGHEVTESTDCSQNLGSMKNISEEDSKQMATVRNKSKKNQGTKALKSSENSQNLETERTKLKDDSKKQDMSIKNIKKESKKEVTSITKLKKDSKKDSTIGATKSKEDPEKEEKCKIKAKGNLSIKSKEDLKEEDSRITKPREDSKIEDTSIVKSKEDLRKEDTSVKKHKEDSNSVTKSVDEPMKEEDLKKEDISVTKSKEDSKPTDNSVTKSVEESKEKDRSVTKSEDDSKKGDNGTVKSKEDTKKEDTCVNKFKKDSKKMDTNVTKSMDDSKKEDTAIVKSKEDSKIEDISVKKSVEESKKKDPKDSKKEDTSVNEFKDDSKKEETIVTKSVEESKKKDTKDSMIEATSVTKSKEDSKKEDTSLDKSKEVSMIEKTGETKSVEESKKKDTADSKKEDLIIEDTSLTKSKEDSKKEVKLIQETKISDSKENSQNEKSNISKTIEGSQDVEVREDPIMNISEKENRKSGEGELLMTDNSKAGVSTSACEVSSILEVSSDRNQPNISSITTNAGKVTEVNTKIELEVKQSEGPEPASQTTPAENSIKTNETTTSDDTSDHATEVGSSQSSEQAVILSIDDHVQSSNLPDKIDDTEFNDKLKVFNNYRNFGAMYFAKKNFKKAEWAYKNGIKQSMSGEARSKEQVRLSLTAEVEFRLSRARCLKSMGLGRDAASECRAILKIESNQEAADLLKSL